MTRATLILYYFFQVVLSTVLAKSDVPRKITLTSRVVPRSLKRRRLSPVNLPLADFFNGTDLQWFGNISVGTPPQHTTAVFDTGSSSLEITSTLCNTCINQVRFDPSKSSTFVDGRTSLNISFGTGVGVDPVINDNYQMTLRAATETVSVGGLTAPNISVYLVENQTSTFDIDPFSSIVGMGPKSIFFVRLINQSLPSLFGMYLTPLSVGNAELTFGGIDKTKFKSHLTYVSIPSGSKYWELSSSGIFVNGKTTAFLNASESILPVIFDSGTSNVVFPTNITEAIYALISPEIKPYPTEPGAYGIPCSHIPTLPAVIDIGFTAQDGTPFNLTIPSNELSVGPFRSNASLCQTLINALDGFTVVGGSLLKHYYTVWDVGGQRMGFAAVR